MIARANSTQEALDPAAQRTDRTIQWSHPKAPVLGASYHPRTINSFDFKKGASLRFINRAIYDINGVSGFAEKFVSHDIRSGAARDLASIPSSEILGVANPAVAKAMGHTYGALSKGVTDNYAGAINQDLNQLKWAHQTEDQAMPRQGAPRRQEKRITSAAIDERLPNIPLSKEELDRTRHNIALELRKEAETARIENIGAAPPSTTPSESDPRAPLTPTTSSQLNALQPLSRKRSPSTELECPPQHSYPEPDEDASWDPTMTNADQAAVRDIENILGDSDLSEDMMQVIQETEEENAFDAMLASFQPTTTTIPTPNQDPTLLSSPAFIVRLSQINISYRPVISTRPPPWNDCWSKHFARSPRLCSSAH